MLLLLHIDRTHCTTCCERTRRIYARARDEQLRVRGGRQHWYTFFRCQRSREVMTNGRSMDHLPAVCRSGIVIVHCAGSKVDRVRNIQVAAGIRKIDVENCAAGSVGQNNFVVTNV
jgi:hypothetical protein